MSSITTYKAPLLCDQPCADHCVYARELCHAQKLASLGLMVSEIAHDLNNLHSIILGHSELALDKAGTAAPLREHLQDIRTAAHNAGSLCRDLLSYAGKPPPAPSAVDVGRLANELQQLIRVLIPTPVHFDCRIAADLPGVRADPNHIRQILLNLILNAAEAIREKPGTITLNVEHRHARETDAIVRQQIICIEVSDNGCGMDAATCENLFKPFFSTKAGGRGLGLPAVRGLVEALGGTVDFMSRPGEGTVFTIGLPACADTPDMPIPDRSDLADEEWHGVGTVLLAEDEPRMRTWCADVLAQMELTVLTAADGVEAVDCYRRHADEVDLVLLDISMPRMDGCEALARIREINPGARVIIISGYTESDLAHRWEEATPDDILLKPFTIRELKRSAIPFFNKQQTARYDCALPAQQARVGTDSA